MVPPKRRFQKLHGIQGREVAAPELLTLPTIQRDKGSYPTSRRPPDQASEEPYLLVLERQR